MIILSMMIIMMVNEKKIQFIKDSIETIPDYPIPGVLFRDITTLLDNPAAYQATIDLLVEHYKNKGITKIVGTEARGFLFGAPVALRLGVGFVPVRKEGKLPRATLRQNYELEYGSDTLEIHKESISAKDNVLVVDDLLATGGTIEATVRLIRQLGGKVNEAAFIICLPDLGGIERLKKQGVNCFNLVEFPGH
uniref:Adenine phosphoribosyltransferase n=3 Tax=Arsenophonus nasoniae TaxID=638 RepID=D2TWE4_9GAMM|nr:adenine phosphoribosyltransferase [Arsenophonus nasoniae]